MKKQDDSVGKNEEIRKIGNDTGVTIVRWKIVAVLSACALVISIGFHIWEIVKLQKLQNVQIGQSITAEQDGTEMQEQSVLVESFYLENGDHVSTLPVINAEGVNLSGLPIEKSMNLVVYLSDSCGGCLSSMGTLRDMMGVFGEEEMGYAYLYSNSVPRNLEEKYGISREFCYCLGENLMLATSLPTFYLVDGDGIVIFSTDKLELVIQKLLAMEIMPQEKLIEQADAYLLERYFTESDRSKIIYFAMKGCGDCEAADELIDTTAAQERYEMVRIYKDRTEEDGEIGDDFGLFREVYGIVWYPSFEILRGAEREFVGEVSLEELESILMK
ncbi:MAG: thioredoxin family protein [bacterium]|nr:thioredoxin family protein [bacterium]